MATVGKESVNYFDTPYQIYDKTHRAIIQVEFFMAAAAMLLFFQLVCGSLRRRSNHPFIQGGLWVAYTLLPPLVIYTLGLMQSSQVMIVIIYPVWALSLFLIAGGANSITAYDLDDNRQWKRGLFDILQYDIYFGIVLFRLLYSTEAPNREMPREMVELYETRLRLRKLTILPVFILFTAVCFAHTFRTIASWMVTYSYPSKVVADYMKDYAAAAAAAAVPANSRLGGGDHSKDDSFDPATMKGCKYMVHWPAYKVTGTWNGKSSLYRCETVPKEGVITVGMIWDEVNEARLISHGLNSSRIKSACLSYSLSHLLRRRFFGMDCAETNLPETRRFVLEGLLSDNNASDEYKEAFRVIEMELAFLYDFFYTRYALIFGMEGHFFLIVMVKIVCSFALGLVLLYSSWIQRFRGIEMEGYYFVAGLTVTRISVTAAIIGAFLLVEALQFILYLGSDWAKVSLACCFLTGRGNPDGFIPLALRKRFGFLISKWRFPLLSGYWQNNLGQYSVIEGSKFFSLRKDFAFESNTLSMFIFSKAIAFVAQSLGNLFSKKGFQFVKLPEKLKPQIVSILKSNGSDGHLTNGKASLERNGFLQQFSWTLKNETQTETMLIWHIATDYCRIICDDADLRSRQPPCYDNHEVATKLSCYCAYLMSKVPELLPGNSIDTRSIFDEVMYKAREALGTDGRNKDGLQRALAYSGVDNSILTKGLKLGTELESIKDTSLRWKVTAEFWAETILYIAPSDNANAHMERLAQGGEFLTHLWALLTHAGILHCDQEPNLAQGEGLA